MQMRRLTEISVAVGISVKAAVCFRNLKI